MNDKTQAPHSQVEALDLRDLLVDAETDSISEYLTVSVSNDGHNTTVSFTTTDAHPETYTTVLYGITASNLQMLLNDSPVNPSDSVS